MIAAHPETRHAPLPPGTSGTGAPEPGIWFEVQHFLFEEARLLDERAFEPWLGLLAEDIRYTMPLVTNRTGRDVGREVTPIEHLSHFEEDYTSLRNRARRFATGMAWADSPPARTRRMVANVQVRPGSGDGELEVCSNFLLYRSHLEHDVEIFVGRRADMLRRTAQGLKIARREILLDQAVVTQKSLGLFF